MSHSVTLIRSGKQSARKLNRAQILLLADEGKADSEIAEALHTGTATRQRFVEGNLEGALNERRRPGGQKKLGEKGGESSWKPGPTANRRQGGSVGHCSFQELGSDPLVAFQFSAEEHNVNPEGRE